MTEARQVKEAMRNIDARYRTLCLSEWAENAYQDPRSSEAASLLYFARVGIVLSQETCDTVVNRLSELAIIYDLEPDTIQEVLLRHEPSLAEEQAYYGEA